MLMIESLQITLLHLISYLLWNAWTFNQMGPVGLVSLYAENEHHLPLSFRGNLRDLVLWEMSHVSCSESNIP